MLHSSPFHQVFIKKKIDYECPHSLVYSVTIPNANFEHALMFRNTTTANESLGSIDWRRRLDDFIDIYRWQL